MPGYEFCNYRRPVAGHPSVDLLPIAICRYHGEGYGEMVTLIVGGRSVLTALWTGREVLSRLGGVSTAFTHHLISSNVSHTCKKEGE
jgi:hypothetical protein